MLQKRPLKAIIQATNYCEQFDDVEKAIEFYNKVIEIDGLEEAIYQPLMLCYQKTGRRAGAMKLLKGLCRKLPTNLGIEPSGKIKYIYPSLIKEP